MTQPKFDEMSQKTHHQCAPAVDIPGKVLDLIYWRDPKKSGVAFAAILTVFVLNHFPLILILSYTGLAVLAGTVGIRVLKAVEAQIKKTDGFNPFQPYLEQELLIPAEKLHTQVDVIVEHVESLARRLRRLFLVESITESFRFGLVLWVITYIGAGSYGTPLVFFTLVAISETYKDQIDARLAVAKEYIENKTKRVEQETFERSHAKVEKKDQ